MSSQHSRRAINVKQTWWDKERKWCLMLHIAAIYCYISGLPTHKLEKTESSLSNYSLVSHCSPRSPSNRPSKQPIRTRYLGHVTGYKPIRNQYFLAQFMYCVLENCAYVITSPLILLSMFPASFCCVLQLPVSRYFCSILA